MSKKMALEAALAEAKKKKLKLEAKATVGLAKLFESELDRASVLLSAEAIVERLNDMAERVAKIEADDLMPLDAPLKAQVGDEAAKRFYNQVVTSVRGLLDQIKSASDAISVEIRALETGEIPNDMAITEPQISMDDAPEADLADLDPEAEPEAEADLADLEVPAAPEPEEVNDEPALGRMRKDALKESSGDKVVVRQFRIAMREGMNPQKAAVHVAKMFDIDISDVKTLVREAASKKVIRESETMPYEEWIVAVDKEMDRRFSLPLLPEVGEEEARRYYKSSQQAGETVDEFVTWYGEKYDLFQF